MKRLFAAWRDPAVDANAPRSTADAAPPHPDAAKKRPAVIHARGPNVVSSSSSSDGSVVQTPEPDDDFRPSPPPTPRWASWIKPKPSKPKTTHVAAVWDPLPSIPRLPAAAAAAAPHTESDDDSDHYGTEGEQPPAPAPAAAPATRKSRAPQPVMALRAQMNLRALTLAAISPPTAPPPFLHPSAAPLFPRSMNPARKLPRLPDTHAVLLRTALLRRLEAPTLSRAESQSIAPLGNRPRRAVPKARPAGRELIDEEAVSGGNQRVRYYSQGLQAWLARPCFEERCVLWTWDAHGREIILRGVVGSGRAVASLEFSEAVEALAGYGVEPLPAVRAPCKTTAPVLRPLHITAPSIQLEAVSSDASTPTPNPSTGPPTPTSAISSVAPTPRKVLRFVSDPEPDPEQDEDEDEDNIPLGFQVRGRRHLEALERQAEERARLAAERAREEERMRRVLAHEVKAARARREGARSGLMHEVELERMKDRRASYSRPAYDPAPHPRRLASEPDPRTAGHLRPPSVSETHQSRRPSSLSRPPSTTDVQHPKPRPESIRASPRAPVSPLPRASTMQSVEDEKKRRRASAISEGSGTWSVRSSTAPPVPFMPVSPMAMMPMYPAIPGTPQFFYMQAQAQTQMPLLPPNRPGLITSRSAEGLQTPRAPFAARQQDPPSPRRGNIDPRRRSSPLAQRGPLQ